MSSSLNTVQSIPKYGVSLHCFFSRIRIEFIFLTLCGRIRVRETPYPGIFYTLKVLVQNGKGLIKADCSSCLILKFFWEVKYIRKRNFVWAVYSYSWNKGETMKPLPTLHKKWRFLLRISIVNMNSLDCLLLQRNSYMDIFFFVQCLFPYLSNNQKYDDQIKTSTLAFFTRCMV